MGSNTFKQLKERQSKSKYTERQAQDSPLVKGVKGFLKWAGIGTAANIASGAAVSAVGFTKAGVAAGSVAAGVQSTIGLVKAGSLFAGLQSVGAVGAGFLSFPVIGAVALVGGGWALGKAIFKNNKHKHQ